MSDLPPSVPSEPSGDGELVRQTLAGDRAAFDSLIRKHQRQAMAVSYRLLSNTNDAMDVTQDAFLRAYGSLATLQNPEAFAGWLMRIVSNLSLNFRRSRKTRAVQPIEAVTEDAVAEEKSAGGSPLRALQGRELGERLQQALAQLPEKQRNAVLMFTIEQMPQKDVAAALKCSVEAVKWHVFEGRRKLKEMLKDCL